MIDFKLTQIRLKQQKANNSIYRQLSRQKYYQPSRLFKRKCKEMIRNISDKIIQGIQNVIQKFREEADRQLTDDNLLEESLSTITLKQQTHTIDFIKKLQKIQTKEEQNLIHKHNYNHSLKLENNDQSKLNHNPHKTQIYQQYRMQKSNQIINKTNQQQIRRQFRIKKSEHKMNNYQKNLTKKQQLLKLSYIATKKNAIHNAKKAQQIMKANIDFICELRGKPKTTPSNQWKQQIVMTRPLPQLRQKNFRKIQQHRLMLSKREKQAPISSKKQLRKVQVFSPKRPIPYNVYNIYKMNGNMFEISNSLK